jgi:hypothetical protein
MKKLLLACVSLFFIQPLALNAAPTENSLPHRKPIFANIKQMEDQCAAAYISTFNQMPKPPLLSVIKSYSRKNKDEVYVTVEFVKSGSPSIIKYQCTFKKGSIETYGVEAY